MSETFQKILIKDDRIGAITDAVKYGVYKGAQNVTSYTYKAISHSTSSHVFNIAIPSLETVISREVLWRSTVTLRIVCSDNKPNHLPPVNYGVTDALAAFPLHSLVATMTATINNNTVATNMADILPAMLRLMDPEELAYYNDMTPTTLDYLSDYAEGVDALPYTIAKVTSRVPEVRDPGTGAITTPEQVNDRLVLVNPGNAYVLPTGAITAAADTTLPNFASELNRQFTGTSPIKFISYPNNVLSFDHGRCAGTGKKHRPRGSYRILEMYALDGAAGAANRRRRIPGVNDNEIYVTFEVTEPLLLSPFCFGTTAGKQGMYGIQTLNFQMNMLSNASRAWRSARYLINPGNGVPEYFTKQAFIQEFSKSELIFQFLTPHASELLPSRNTIPFYEMPVYRTAGLTSQNITALGNGDCFPNVNNPALSTANVGRFREAPTFTIHSNNIQLSGIPDKLLIFVRRQIGSLTCCDSDSFLTITGIRINFNNQAGLLSSMTLQQLYTNSVLSGLNNMSYDEFSGLTVSVSGRGGPPPGSNSAHQQSAPFEPFYGMGAGTGSFLGFKYIPTVGSLLVLNFAEVIQLTDEYYAPGSLGTFNLQLTLDVQNNHKNDWRNDTAELIIIPINSGVFVNERGTSSTFISLLTKQDVLSTLEQEPYTNFEVRRMVGGSSFFDNLRNGVRWLGQKVREHAPQVLSNLATTAKGIMASSGSPYGAAGAAALGALGYGRNHRAISDRTG